MNNYQMVIGIEVHAQLATATKAFCSCELSAHAMENTKVCEVCSAQPGTLPVLNKSVLDYAIKMALATNCTINKLSFFDRKNYFYPDLPKGYQISQFEVPIAQDGIIKIYDDEGNVKDIGIERIQIEEDTGKSTHDNKESLISLNRAGTPLIEIVGRPDIRTAKEASQYLKSLYSILTYLGINNGNLQDGNFRADVNLSLMPKGSKEFGTRTEMKNLNSFKSAEKAIELESLRQAKILDAGQKVLQQTLNFDLNTNEIKVMRTKSDAHDYRYFPEPDLLPLAISEEKISLIKKSLPELPAEKKSRFVKDYELSDYDADVLTSNRQLAQYFETTVENYQGKPKKAANWIMVELLRFLNEADLSIEKTPVPPQEISALLNFVDEGLISGKMAKSVFEKMFDEKKSAQSCIESLGLKQISGDGELEEIIDQVLTENPSEVDAFKGGKKKLMGFFVGQVMQKTKGQANPGKVNKILAAKLSTQE